MKNNNTKYFSTPSLDIVALLLVKGHTLLRIDPNPQDSRQLLMFFDYSPDIDSLLDDYYADKVEVPALSFFKQQQRLKNMIWMKKRNEYRESVR